MRNSLDLSDCLLVNDLWAEFSETLGMQRAVQAVREALDLNHMTGGQGTIPILFMETCGIALTTFKILRNQTGLSFDGDNKVIIFSHRKKSFQVLSEVK